MQQNNEQFSLDKYEMFSGASCRTRMKEYQYLLSIFVATTTRDWGSPQEAASRYI